MLTETAALGCWALAGVASDCPPELLKRAFADRELAIGLAVQVKVAQKIGKKRLAQSAVRIREPGCAAIGTLLRPDAGSPHLRGCKILRACGVLGNRHRDFTVFDCERNPPDALHRHDRKEGAAKREFGPFLLSGLPGTAGLPAKRRACRSCLVSFW